MAEIRMRRLDEANAVTPTKARPETIADAGETHTFSIGKQLLVRTKERVRTAAAVDIVSFSAHILSRIRRDPSRDC